MALVEGSPDDRPRCAHCGEVIGVYEMLVHVVHGRPEQTSRAARPEITTAWPGPFYHWPCYGLADRPAR